MKSCFHVPCPFHCPAFGQKDSKESSGDELVLKMIGKAKTLVYRTVDDDDEEGRRVSSHREAAWQEQEVISYETQLAAFGGRVFPGRHSFQYSVMLPPRLPPTMQVRLAAQASAAVGLNLEQWI